MKKVLLASTFLALSAAVAAADVTLSGYGRFGLDHNGGAAAGVSDTQVNMRFRLNIDAATETDSGVTFGGRVRLQYDDGRAGARLSAAYLYATYEGLRVEVGNANTALDSVALLYNAELGYLDRTFGGGFGDYYAFSTGPYGGDEEDRMGIYASYAISGINLRMSYIDPDQTTSIGAEELSFSADYTTGQFTLAAAYVDNTGGNDLVSTTFLGAEYALSDAANVGVLYFDQNSDSVDAADARRVTVYGNYTTGALQFEGYVADDNNVANLTDTSFGVGANYDLGGGARLGADIHRNYAEDTIVGLGVRFNF